MDEQFKTLFTKRLEELTADLEFFDKPTGGSTSPQVIMTQLPSKSAGHLKGEDFPLLCWTHYRGELSHLSPRGFDVIIDGGILVDDQVGSSMEQIIKGTADVDELITALHPLAGKRVFGSWKLQLPFSYEIGDTSAGHEGRQPHPYYWVRFKLSFVGRVNARK